MGGFGGRGEVGGGHLTQEPPGGGELVRQRGGAAGVKGGGGTAATSDDLEDLLDRYRRPLDGAEEAVPADSQARPLINFGYTGM